MMFPLVRDLAAEGFPVRLTCGVLGFTPPAFYKWSANPVSDRDWDDAHVTNELIDAHADDPEFARHYDSTQTEPLVHAHPHVSDVRHRHRQR